MKTLADIEAESQSERFDARTFIYSETLPALKVAIQSAYPQQVIGRSRHIANTGEEYVEISAFGLARNREYDIAQVKKAVVQSVTAQFRQYAKGKPGAYCTLYWRIEPEEDVRPAFLVENFSDEGPDEDPITGLRCYADRDWVRCGVYMRLLISAKPELPEV